MITRSQMHKNKKSEKKNMRKKSDKRLGSTNLLEHANNTTSRASGVARTFAAQGGPQVCCLYKPTLLTPNKKKRDAPQRRGGGETCCPSRPTNTPPAPGRSLLCHCHYVYFNLQHEGGLPLEAGSLIQSRTSSTR